MYVNLAKIILGYHRDCSDAQIIALANILNDTKYLANLAKLQLLDSALEFLAGDMALQRRMGSIFIGGFPTPCADSTGKLIRQARAELKSTRFPSAFAGLSVLLIHPYSDGNGRMARLIWAAALMTREKYSPTLICKHLEKLRFGLQTNIAVQVQLAALGDPAAFYRRWDASIEAASLAPQN
jgi:hypothetical protein